MMECCTVDWSKALTEGELDSIRKHFKTIPTYVADEHGGHVDSSQTGALWSSIGYKRSDQEFEYYKYYWDTHHGSKIPIESFLKCAAKAHDNAEWFKHLGTVFDADGNGFISENEFNSLFKYVQIHDQKLKALSYQEFVNQADTNKDGKVSIEECAAWIKKQTEELN